jgi:hypothetical protein
MMPTFPIAPSMRRPAAVHTSEDQEVTLSGALGQIEERHTE